MTDRVRRIMSRGVAAGAAQELAGGSFDEVLSAPGLTADDVTASDTLKVPVKVPNVSTTPTEAELTAAFGTPAQAGAGFFTILNDEGLSGRVFLVCSDGSFFYHSTVTKAL